MAMRVCFMVMPYGKRITNAEPATGPGQIDFDALWEKALRPMIQEDLKFLPVRADQDAGALILQAMIERLAISDLVIADITLPNANVYYEVGVRHAAQKQGCVMIAAAWSKPLFDINQMRRVTYPLSEGTITNDTATEVRRVLSKAIGDAMDHVSPVYQAIPGYPEHIDAKQLQSFRDVANRLAQFQAEVAVAKTLPAEDAAVKVKQLVSTYAEDAGVLPGVALDLIRLLRDLRKWNDGLEFIGRLPDRILQLPVVREQRALMLGKAGKRLEAITELEALIQIAGETSERRGLIGGRYKELYEDAPDAATKLSNLNRAISSYERGMMLDLNDYFPSSNLPRLYLERHGGGDEQKALKAATVATLGCERSRKRNPDDPWAAPTMLGAAFDAGDVGSAARLLEEINQTGPAAFYLDSTIPDLRRSLFLAKDSSISEQLAEILAELQRKLDPNGTVTALAGRRVDAANAPESRFPAENVVAVTQRLHNMLVGTASTGVVCSAAAGADILALEAASKIGIPRRIVLPFPKERFRSTSVVDRGEDWGMRFDALFKQIPSEHIIELGLDKDERDTDSAYSAVNARILEEAAKWGAAAGRRCFAAVVWNGLTRGATDLTDAFRQLAFSKKLTVISIPTL